MTDVMTPAPPEPAVDEVPRRPTVRPSGADRVFLGITKAAGLSTFVLMAAIGGFLLKGAWPTLRRQGASFFTGFEWNASVAGGSFGVAAIVYYTVAIAVVAMAIAVPLAIATALFVNEYAPRRARPALIAMVDLFAAVPSLIYGLWGRELASTQLQDVARWMDTHLSFIPPLRSPTNTYDGSTFIAAMIVALMINKKGIKGRAQAYIKPNAIIAPFKLISDLAVPISLACRLFGNMLGGMIVVELLYFALGAFSVGVPALLGLYFNAFHPLIQYFIFINLSLTFIGEAVEETE